MFRPLARVMLLTAALLTALLLIVQARSYDASRIDDFFASCTPMPCWQGIHPGITTTDEALTILRAHPWVGRITQVNASPYEGSARTDLIYWSWSQSYPFSGMFLTPQQGIVITNRGLVRQIYLTTSIAFGDLWLALGGLDGGALDYVDNTRTIRIDNTALFTRDGVAATASVIADCSMTALDFWSTPIFLWLQDGQTLGVENVAYPVYLRVMRAGYHQVRAALC